MTATSSVIDPKKRQCIICGRMFDNPDLLNEHTRLDHSESSEPPVGVG